MKQSIFRHVIISSALLAFSLPVADAAMQCYDCHGTSSPADYRPLDEASRNPATGGFQGNHRTHMDAPAAPSACNTCHPGSSAYITGHRDGKIKVSSRINNSPLTTTYKNSTSAFNQSATPALGSCANVNCHFENVTPAWGSDPSATSCTTCHGAPPSGGSSGAAGSHARHVQYFPGTSNCLKCHANNTSFQHATSAGNRNLAISFAAAPNNGNGAYSGALNDYLPSQTNSFGNCTATYCHSPGTKSASFNPPNQTATWGGTLGCAGCHAATPSTGSHAAHVETTYGVPVACHKCHAATVTSGMTIYSTSRHVNKLVNIAFNSSTTAIFGKYSGHVTPMQKNPGSGYANCENVYCHSNGQNPGGTWPPTYSTPKWGAAATGECGTCHDHGYHGGVTKINSGSHDKHMGYGFAGSITSCGICHYGSGFATPSCGQCHFGSSALTDLHINHKVDLSFLSSYGGTYNGTPEPGDGYSSCSNVYCHSNGTSVATASVPANTSPAWGSGAMTCNGCHGNLSYGDSRKAFPLYTTGKPKANSHKSHISITCNKCHFNTTSDGVTITSTTNHVNKAYNVNSGDGATFTYTFNASGGSCSSISCHFNNSAQWGTTIACGGCHAVTAATLAGRGHFTHLSSAFGPRSTCDACHGAGSSTGEQAGHGNGTINFADGNNLASTTSCNTCHSPGGTYDGVGNATYGARANWTLGVYSSGVLKGGKEKWCVSCHDNDVTTPSIISGVTAPNVAGSESGAYTYGTGWGYYKTGHGLPASATYAASGGLTYGAGIECGSCHDLSAVHTDGSARTYTAASNNYQAGYRLKSVNGMKPMNVPRPNSIPLIADDFKLCFSCHDSNKYLLQSPALVTTSFRDDVGDPPASGDPIPVNAHEFHLDNLGLRFDSDWKGGYDSQFTCVNCHNVHGSTRIAMVNDGKLVNHEPGLQMYYAKSGTTAYNPPWPPDEPSSPVTLDQSDGTVWSGVSGDNICSDCHGGNYGKYVRTPPAAPQAPVLSWTGESGYTTDGVEPDSMLGGSYYSFRIKYSDANYQPPRSIQVWVDENDNGIYESNEKYDMQDADPADVNCADGKLYRKTMTINRAGDGVLTYRFHASDGKFDATGSPTGDSTLTAANNAPVLSWAGETGYEADGVNPNSASGGASFTFRVKYTDIDNNVRSSMQVWIDENDNGVYDAGEKLDMNEVDPGDTTYSDGKLYTLTRAIPFAGDGVINYRFHASDGLLDATGTPTTNRSLTVTASNSAPVLSWTGETNYVRDGVNPDADTDGSSFTFRVKYTDADDNPGSVMQVWVDENNDGIYEAGEKYDMTAVDTGDTDYADGKLFTRTLALAANGNGLINYRFFASDGSANASGTPTEDSIVTVLAGAITVSCLGGEDHTTIQAAINAASSGDTILVSDCTYTEKVTVDAKSITIKSVNGAGTTIIDGGGSGGAVVKFQNGADSTLNGFTVRNGAGGLYGGGIYISNAAPAITNSIITANDADNGAGIYLTTTGSSTVTISNSTVSNNTTSALEGGGLYLGSGASAAISGSTFSNNQGRYSGGVYMTTSANASLTISDSAFTGNRGTLAGGAIYLTASGGTVPLTISNSTFTNNDANDNGGAIFMSTAGASATLTVTGSTFTGNNTTSQGSALDGGAIYLASVSSTIINGSTFTGNTARSGGALYVSNSGANSLSVTDSVINSNSASGLQGGGLYISGGAAGTYTATIERTTIAGNQADDNGGGAYLTGSVAATFTNCMITGNKAVTLDGGGLHLTGATIAPTVINSTIAGNHAQDQGGGIYNLGGLAFDLKNSILWNNRDYADYPDIAGPATVSYSDVWQPGFSGSNNISSNPNFLAPLDSSLAPTAGGNYHLPIDSSAMDAGTATGAPADDIDGNLRPMGAGIDMGADEIVSVANNTPLLAWTGEPDYSADGVNPNIGAGGASFEFRVNYSDSDNNAPSSIQVWVDTNNNGIYEPGEKYAMSEVDAGDTTYTDGKLYTRTLNLGYAGNGVLNYRFYSADTYSQATGQPTADNTVQINNAPTLSWLGSGNYVSDGVDPESGLAGSNFEFRIRYTDPDNNPPTSIQVWADRNDDGDYLDPGEKITMTAMTPGDTNYADGKDYTATVALSKAGDNTLKYRFFASDGTPATGDPTTTELNITVSNNAPTLDWTGETNYVGNGVNPDAAIFGTDFTFRVKYSDPDNEAPAVYQVWIDENNNGIYDAGEKFDMALAGDAAPANDGNNVNGEIYTRTRTLNTPGAIIYKFVFNDGFAAATGTPASDSTVSVAAGSNQAPVLSWDSGTCLTDGVRPRTGAINTDFEFRVKYSDADNQCPGSIQVTVNATPYDLTSNDGASCQTGRVYYRSMSIATAGDLNYSFSATDGIDPATGGPTSNRVVSAVNTTFKVRPTGDTGWGGASWYNNIKDAIAATTGTSTILVYPNSNLTAATYGEGGTGISFSSKSNRTVQSVCGRDLTTISGGTNVVTVGSTNVIMDGFTITGGTTYGVYYNASPASGTLKNSKVSANATGIYLNQTSTLTIEDSLIQNNTTRGINSASATALLKVYRSTISDNNSAGGANPGGGIYYNSGSGIHIIEDSVISNNKSGTQGGGGIAIINGSQLTISRSSISNNFAGSGGGIFNNSTNPTLTISDSYIQGNSATSSGGGININTGTLTMTNVIISGNKATSATSNGGGIYSNTTYAPVACLYCTISGNYAGNMAGAFYRNAGTATFRNSVIYNNDALNQPNYKQIYALTSGWQSVDVYNTLINQIPGSATYVNGYESLGGNLNEGTRGAEVPNFVDPRNPADAPTAAGNHGNYHLQSNSYCIDAGGNYPASPNKDIDGQDRPNDVSGKGDGVDDYDMGADEYVP